MRTQDERYAVMDRRHCGIRLDSDYGEAVALSNAPDKESLAIQQRELVGTLHRLAGMQARHRLDSMGFEETLAVRRAAAARIRALRTPERRACTAGALVSNAGAMAGTAEPG